MIRKIIHVNPRIYLENLTLLNLHSRAPLLQIFTMTMMMMKNPLFGSTSSVILVRKLRLKLTVENGNLLENRDNIITANTNTRGTRG